MLFRTLPLLSVGLLFPLIVCAAEMPAGNAGLDSAAGYNLIANGGFEQTSVSNRTMIHLRSETAQATHKAKSLTTEVPELKHWRFEVWGNAAGIISLNADAAVSGAQGLLIDLPARGGSLTIRQDIPAGGAEKVYKITFLLKKPPRGLSGSIRIICLPYSADGKARDTGKIIRFDEYADKDGTARFEWLFPTYAKTEKMSAHISFDNESDAKISVRIDDVRLTRYDPEKGVELPAEKPGSS